MKGVLVDITGQKFNRLTAIERAHVDRRGNTYWRFRCECGGEKVARGTHVRGGITKSCGCRHSENGKEWRRKGLAAWIANGKRRKKPAPQPSAAPSPAGTLDGFTAAEQSAITAAIAAGKVTRIRQGEFPDEGRLYRKSRWAHGSLQRSA